MSAPVVVVGGGHNGLVAAALVARAGHRVVLLERGEQFGGALGTEEFHPGFRAPSTAHALPPLRPGLAAALGLKGLEWIAPEPRAAALSPDGPGVVLWGDATRTAEGLRRRSSRDGEAFVRYHQALSRVARAVQPLLDAAPPDLEAPRARDLLRLLPAGLGVARLGRRLGQDLLRWGPMPVADFAEEWFEDDLLRAWLGGRGVRGMFAGPWSAGTTANLLLQSSLEGGDGAGAWHTLPGGPGAFVEALAGAARSAGVELRAEAEVVSVQVRDGRATGVVLADGSEIAARAVLSGLDPKRTALDLVAPEALAPDERARLRAVDTRGAVAKLHLALDRLPEAPSLGEHADTALRSRLHFAGSLEDIERAFDDAKYGRASARPLLDATIPSLLDPSLAPAGRHVMSVCIQYVPHSAGPDGVADAALAVLDEHLPGLSGCVVARQLRTPRDLESRYGTTGGHPSHAELCLSQLYATRPLIGWARYRTPVRDLYLCGAGTHPGVLASGGSGANAARAVLADLSG